MEVIMILYKYFNADTRVKREAIFLSKKGYNVEVLNCSNPCRINTNPIYPNDIKNNRIVSIKPNERQSIISMVKFWFLAFFHLLKKKKKPQILHAHDLTGLPPAIFFKILFPKVKVIYDSHELFPEAAKDKLNNFYWLCFLFIEIFCGKFINTLIGASPLQLEILRKRISKPQYCLLNVPDLDFIKNKIDYNSFSSHPFNHSQSEKIKIVYSGEVLPYRGYDEFVLAASEILKKYTNYEFWIVGGGIYLENVKEKVEKNNLMNHFIFTGEVKYSDLLLIIYKCDIAIGLYKNTLNNNIMISNKIFEYMLVGIPFIFSNLISSRLYLSKTKAIIIDFPLNPEIIAEKILLLSKDKELQYQISQKSRNLILKQLNWKNESEKMKKIYSSTIIN
jgi:glycosyltransferase involved in cell wall biosynthesis